jgi:hypothetical protein
MPGGARLPRGEPKVSCVGALAGSLASASEAGGREANATGIGVVRIKGDAILLAELSQLSASEPGKCLGISRG